MPINHLPVNSMGFMLALIIVLIYAVWRGWRTGFIHQVAGVLGIAFGIVAARLLADPIGEWLVSLHPGLDNGFLGPYRVKILAMALVFAAFYFACTLLGSVLRSALSLLHAGALNSICGSAFSLLKWVMIMSVTYNVILALKPDSDLAAFCDDGDSNLVEAVMELAPALAGTDGPDELLYRRQQEQARQISRQMPTSETFPGAAALENYTTNNHDTPENQGVTQNI